VWKGLKQADVFHAACHGIASSASPLDSALLLAGDQPLRAGDLLERRFPSVSLAVLSACESGMIGEALPDEVIGLPVALLQAGARTVVASQWAVPDLATAALIVRFYERWRSRASAAEALRDAQVWLRDVTNADLELRYPRTFAPPEAERAARDIWRRGRPYQDPYYWAGFTVVGNGLRRRR
jgi:CHAT domain-containing protein